MLLGSYAQVTVNETRAEVDSHADTTSMGSSTTLVLPDYEQPVHVHGYTTDIASEGHSYQGRMCGEYSP